MSVMPEFSARPFAIADLTGDENGEGLSDLLTALLDDGRALGPVVGYDHATMQINAVFQVEVDGDTGAASAFAVEVFDRALERSGFSGRAQGIAVVEGADPDQLP